MRACGPEVGGALRIVDVSAETLVLAAPDVGQPHPVRTRRRGRVQVDGHPEALGHGRAELPCVAHAVVDRGVPQRHEGNDIDRADARMLAVLKLHVDVADGDLDGPRQRTHDGVGVASQGQDRSVVAGVAGAVQEIRATHGAGRVGQPIDDVEAPTLGVVGHGFDQARHLPIVPDWEAHPMALEPLGTPPRAARQSRRG
jgi:hypothetical protein